MNHDFVFNDVKKYSESLSKLNLCYTYEGQDFSTTTRLHQIEELIITYSENKPSVGFFYNIKSHSNYYGLRFLLEGSELYHFGQNKLLLTASECMLFQPRHSSFYERKTTSIGINFLIPQKILAPKIIDFNQLGTKLICSSGFGKLIYSGVASLELELHLLTDAQKVFLASHLVDLIADWLNENQTKSKDLFLSVKEYIDQHIEDPLLQLQTMSIVFNKSSRTIQDLFKRENMTFSNYLLDQRLILASK